MDARDPLVTIDFAVADPRYGDPLRYAVRAAETRRAGVRYDVIAVVPNATDAAAGQTHGQDVMRTIMLERVPSSRVNLGLRIDPSVSSVRVLVYVR